MAILLAPDVDGASAVMAQNFGVCTALTAWSNALLNTTLYPLDPKPTWYDGLQTQLQSCNAAARTWVETSGPSVVAGAPQSFIDFGNLFNAAAPDVESTMTAITASNGTATADQMSLLTQTISTLLAQAQSAQTAAGTFQSTVKTFADTIRMQHDALATTISNAEATLTADEKQIAKLQRTIASLQNTLGIDSTSAANTAMSANMSGLTLFGTLLVFSLFTIGSGGAASPLIAIATAAVTVSVNGARNASQSRSVQADLEALGEDQQMLDADHAQTAGLRAILNMLDKLLECNTAVAYAADIIVPIWDDVVARLEYTSEVLTQPTLDLTKVSALTMFSEAATKWTSIVTAATNVQASSMSMTGNITLSAQASA